MTFELGDGPEQDLYAPELKALILKFFALGVFLGWGAAPVCSSFSQAVWPHVCTLEHPRGLGGISSSTKKKVTDGNLCAHWLLELMELSLWLFLVENPGSSYLFALPPWRSFSWLLADQLLPLRSSLAEKNEIPDQFSASFFLSKDHRHVVPRSWTMVVQEYPKGV